MRRFRSLLVGYFVLMLLAAGWNLSTDGSGWWRGIQQGISRLIWEEVFALTEWPEDSLADIFALCIPMWREGSQAVPVSGLQPTVTLRPAGALFTGVSLVKSLLGVELGRPASYFQAGLPLLALAGESGGHPAAAGGTLGNPEAADVAGASIPEAVSPAQSPGSAGKEGVGKEGAPPAEQVPAPVQEASRDDSGGPQVLIYNTHSGETFVRTDGVVKKVGEHGGVFTVATALARALETKHNIKVLQSPKIHDRSWLKENPYQASGITVAEALKANPSIKVVIDVHRDAQVPRANSVTKINGQMVAKVMLVVGTNARNNNPKWMQNYLFTKKIGTQMNKLYPGLLRKIMTKRGRYNQHLHPRAILLEIGTTENYTEEAVRSAQLLANVIASCLKE